VRDALGRRGSGIGQALLDRLLQKLDAIPVVMLVCSLDLVRCYEISAFLVTREAVMHRRSS
jgi:hypothetical protein